MYDPPPGFADMIGDAADAPRNTRLTTLTVPDVGVVVARKPRPAAIPTLAMSVNSEEPDAKRAAHSARFVQDHLADGEWERLTTAMLDGDAPDDTIPAVTEAIAVWGTARPYTAVTILAVQTAYLWRTVRLRLLTSGIPDPMRLPTMHTVLDLTERITVESMVGPTADDQQTRFFDRLYGPPPVPVRVGKGRKIVPPPGFSPEEMAASWKAWTARAGAAG